MKSVVFSLVFVMSIGAFASNSKVIHGQDALEIVKVLGSSLGVPGYRQGDSPETMCYHITAYSLKNMYCETAECTPEDGIDRVATADCSLEAVSSTAELRQIKKILKAAGLSPQNSIFSK